MIKLFSKAILCVILTVVMATTTNIFAQTAYPPASQKAMLMQNVGDTAITITYHRPNINKRELWGNKADNVLVPNGEVWRTGANNATVIEFSQDVMINGEKLPKGKYSFYAIPSANDWVLMFNKVWDQWGTVYDEKQDALRVTSKPYKENTSIESLVYTIQDVTPNTAQIILGWGNLRIPFTVDIGDVNARLTQNASRLIMSEQLRMADFVLNTKQTDQYKTALGWMDAMLANGDSFQPLMLKARLQAEMGMKKEAIATGNKALEFGKANKASGRLIALLEGYLKEWTGE